MTTNLRILSLSIIIALILSACNLNRNPSGTDDQNAQALPPASDAPSLTMIVSHTRTDQTLNFSYLVGNTSAVAIPGPVTVTDDKVLVTCPEITTIGNLDNNLDPNEAVTCTGAYTITQADLDIGSVTTLATASASGNTSATITTIVSLQQTRAMTLAKSADPVTYNNVGDTIIYSYVITNSGEATLGPIQFIVNDDKIGAAINCGSAGTILAPGGTVNCSASYLIKEADVTAGSVTNSASATDGTTTSNTITTTINRDTAIPPSNLTPGTTVHHKVVSGEWLWQIARCYGADPKVVVQTNKSQILNPAKISPGMTVTVPNIGSDGKIFGPQPGVDPFLNCAPKYTIQSGDTWESIASRYTASSTLLQSVNPGVALLPGNIIRIPINSVGD
ncbi:MAG: LysM peptidoglycan-binding domain-containing protein [Anaerolineales bacterium]|jgi:LysM repeat protein